MQDIKRKQGYQVVGSLISGYQVYHVNVWNTWDDLALYKSLIRRPNEDNVTLRKRIIAAKDYNSTKQGLVNWLSDSFDLDKYKVSDKTSYFSTYPPLSYMAYSKLQAPSEPYYAPRVIVDDEEIVFPKDEVPLDGSTVEGIVEGRSYIYNYERTEVHTIVIMILNGPPSVVWKLWKNVNQTYHTIWETNTVPDELELSYQYVIDGELYTIEESAKKLTRDDDGNIVDE